MGDDLDWPYHQFFTSFLPKPISIFIYNLNNFFARNVQEKHFVTVYTEKSKG